MTTLDQKVMDYSLAKDETDDVRHDEKAREAYENAEEEEVDDDEFLRSYDRTRRHAVELAAQDERERQAADPLFERSTGKKSGPKGVIADKRWHDAHARKQDDRSRLAGLDRTRGGATASSTLSVVDGYLEAPTAPSHHTHGGVYNSQSRRSRTGSSGSDEDSDTAATAGTRAGEPSGVSASEEEEDDFLASFRAQRLQALRAASGLPSFGRVRMLDTSSEFVEEVDATDARAKVIVIIYEEFLPSCRACLRLLPDLAAAHVHTRIMAVKSESVSESMDVVGLPAAIVYQAGEVVEALVRFTDEVGENPTLAELETYFMSKGHL